MCLIRNIYRDPLTFSEGTWALLGAYINSLQSPYLRRYDWIARVSQNIIHLTQKAFSFQVGDPNSPTQPMAWRTQTSEKRLKLFKMWTEIGRWRMCRIISKSDILGQQSSHTANFITNPTFFVLTSSMVPTHSPRNSRRLRVETQPCGARSPTQLHRGTGAAHRRKPGSIEAPGRAQWIEVAPRGWVQVSEEGG